MSDLSASQRSPSSARFLVVGVTSLCAVLMYLDRFCISILGPYVREDLALSDTQWYWILSAFFLSYALAQVPAAAFSNRFGPRYMLTIFVLLWSACTVLSGVMAGFVALLATRLACGLAQAGGYPTSAALLKRWIPLRHRGLASSIVSLGGRLGGVLAPVLTALLVVELTPGNVSTAITERDLLAPGKIATALVARERQRSDLVTAVDQHLPEGMPARLARLAKRKDTDAASPEEQKDVAALAGFLDSVVSASWLTDELSVHTLGLPNEAVAILHIERPDRSAEQTARLHRLAIEAAFPGAVRHVYTPAWRRVMWLYGAVGIFVAAAYWLAVRDNPPASLRPDKAAESALPSAASPTEPAQPESQAAVLRLLVSSGNLWLVSLAQFGINIGWAFLPTLLPDFLADRFPSVMLEERGRLASIPAAVGCVGMFVGGILTDRLARRLGVRWGRALPVGVAAILCGAIMASCPWIPSPYLVVAALGVMAAMVDLGVPSIWAFIQDICTRNVGAALGWGNMCGNLGAFISPLLFGYIKKSCGEYGWQAAFAAGAASFVLAGICALFMDANQPLEPVQETSGDSPQT